MAATISASTVKELREMTGAGMMDCKRALAECDGDIEAAKDVLRKRGQAIADKKAGRQANEGLVRAHIDEDRGVGVILELNCETDFVARNEGFIQLTETLARQIAAGGPGTKNNDPEEFTNAPDPDNADRKMSDVLREHVAVLGENIALGAFVRIESDNFLHAYIHPPGKLGVLLEISTGKKETREQPDFKDLAQGLAMHIAAAAPEYLSSADVPADVLERERSIYRDQMLAEGKPENIIDKIVEGKLAKFYSEKCLLAQEYVVDADYTVQKRLAKVGSDWGDEIGIVRFVRLRVGG